MLERLLRFITKQINIKYLGSHLLPPITIKRTHPNQFLMFINRISGGIHLTFYGELPPKCRLKAVIAIASNYTNNKENSKHC